MFTALSMFLLLVVLGVILLYRHLTRNFNFWKERNVPYAKPVLFFGNVLKILIGKASVGHLLGDLYKTTKSPYLGFFIFDQPFLLLRDLNLIKECLIKNFDHFDNRTLVDNYRDDRVGSSILFSLKNPTWNAVRVKLTPVFTSGKMKNIFPLMLEAADDLVNYVSRVGLREKSSDVREICMKYTTDVIASCAFGINANCFKHENAEFRVVSRRIFDFGTSRKLQMACYFFAPILVKLFRMKFLEPVAVRFLKDVFSHTLVQREQSNVKRSDLIDILIQIKKQNDDEFDEEMIMSQAIQFFEAGFETTGSTISFTLYEISLNTDIQNRIRSEMRSVLEKHGSLTYEAIQEMNYLDMTLSETLRKYPVLPFLDRRCTKPYKVPGTDLVIEKGVPVYISLYGLHYDPQYFPNPENFNPERFSSENKNARPRFSYMPFGEGPRNCIGARFGLLASKVALTRILMDFEVELSEDTPVPLTLDTKGITASPETTLNLHFKQIQY